MPYNLQLTRREKLEEDRMILKGLSRPQAERDVIDQVSNFKEKKSSNESRATRYEQANYLNSHLQGRPDKMPRGKARSSEVGG